MEYNFRALEQYVEREGHARVHQLYEEGETSPKMMSVGIHPRVTGRPGKSKVLEQFIQYAKGHADVWFARRGDIAKWWWEKYG